MEGKKEGRLLHFGGRADWLVIFIVAHHGDQVVQVFDGSRDVFKIMIQGLDVGSRRS